MIEELRIRITSVPSDIGFDEEAGLIVVPSSDEASLANLYSSRQGQSQSLKSTERLVALTSTGVLNSRDRVAAIGRRPERHVFEIAVDVRVFDGPIAANDPWIGLIRMELGILEPGQYQLVARQTTLHFTNMRHDGPAVEPVTSERRVNFQVLLDQADTR